MRVATSGKLLSCLAALSLLAGSVVTSTALGDLIVRDDFNYPDGNLTGNTPQIGGIWTLHSGTTPVTVVSGQAKINHANSEDTHTNFSTGPIGAGDTIYSGFDLTVPAQSVDPNNVYFAHFKDAGNFFGSRVWITAPSVANAGYRLGITGDSSLETATDLWPGGNLAFDTTYRVVTSYDYDTGTSKLWVDPVNEASLSVTADDTFPEDAFESYAFRQSSANSMQLIDCLQVATTFDEANICIPEPSTVALVLFAFGLVGLGRRTTR